MSSIWANFNRVFEVFQGLLNSALQVMRHNALIQSDCKIFTQQYLWRECMVILYFQRVDVHQGKVASKTTGFGWVCLKMLTKAQTCLDLLTKGLRSLEGIFRLKEILIEGSLIF